MFQDLAGDSSSYRVRVVVLQGMRTILHNHQAHVFMKQELPLLGRMLDDVNEYVRCAMLNLLDNAAAAPQSSTSTPVSAEEPSPQPVSVQSEAKAAEQVLGAR